MKIAVYRRVFCDNNKDFVQDALRLMKAKGITLILHQNLVQNGLLDKIDETDFIFSDYHDLKQIGNIDFIFSFGGDGSFIDSAKIVADLNIPIVGINTGRIGFLTSVTKKNFALHLEMLDKKQYKLEERSLLHLSSAKTLPLKDLFALNDITVCPTDTFSIHGIKVWVNNEKVNTYWSDGLIVATPTGSTAYSLSCGGAILHPSTPVNIITPISSHTLAVRPIIINNDDIIKIKVESRDHKFALSLDTERIEVENPCELLISKEKFTTKTIRFLTTDYYTIIREKLMWGLDLRNVHEKD